MGLRGGALARGFSVYAEQGPIFETLHDRSCPPAQLRGYFAQGTFFSCLQARKDGSSANPHSPAVDQLLDAPDSDWLSVAELALAELEGREPDFTYVSQGIHEEYQRLVFQTERAGWAALRPQLEPYAIDGLAPVMDPEPVPKPPG